MAEQMAIEGQVTTLTAADKATQMRQDAMMRAQDAKRRELEENFKVLEGSESLEWIKLSPKAQIYCLMNRPYTVRTDSGYETCFLEFPDAVRMQGYSMENGLSVLGSDLFPTMKMVNGKPRMTEIGKSSEAKAKMAGKTNTFGPPRYSEEKTRPWPQDSQVPKPAWTKEDRGITCTMTMYVVDQKGDVHPEPSEYTAWLSEWYAGTGKVGGKSYWDKNPNWMLRVRSKEKNISLASGVGQSDLQIDDAPEVTVLPPAAKVESTEFALKEGK